ncbi:UDP-glucuronic acid dehydrogenase [Sphingomonas sp. MAH-20]|uniref:UDP-glucuronic acid dehydrogenase n=1 Tax=Sphingomonas horti TaxID=2682842 RepID=A0A6I4J0M5_9SPHN|nr:MULTISPECIES: formyltransferase family protein [Sphingomonas]MBA2919754.1 UDP-glucuronic acid dehydrogenase [Sphingomonas sp. CGMCC 1.13658]MVO77995.1 UDP-glucuronic acid dehydrogenase [Sphingomonas horti]
MKIAVLCSDPLHPVNVWLQRWKETNRARGEISIYRDYRDLTDGDFLFLISCHQVIRKEVRDRFRFCLVIHASDLPQGRGWSPIVWTIVSGRNDVTVTLLNAEDDVDSGDIWAQRHLMFDGTELHDEINRALFDAETELMTWALTHCFTSTPRPQSGDPTYLPKRSPADSEIDPARPLTEVFDLLRAADPDRYPAFFEHRGQRYRIRLEKM